MVGPAAYQRLAAHPGVSDPAAAADAVVALYADHYFEYDATRRVTLERTAGGTQTDQFSIIQSGNADDYNHWKRRTTQTRADGSETVVYANFAGQTMLQVLRAGDQTWCDFYQYDDPLLPGPRRTDGRHGWHRCAHLTNLLDNSCDPTWSEGWMNRQGPFAPSAVALCSLLRRGHALNASDCGCPAPLIGLAQVSELAPLARALSTAREADGPVVVFLGGHPIKLGLSRYLIDLVDRRLVTHLATNGAALIHDFELALVGGTSEDVPRWLAAGQFGLWQETSRLNDIIAQAARNGEGLGEAVGRVIEEERFPHRDLSIAAACWRNRIPLTCHVTIGADVIHAHPNCDGAALGQTSYTDFLIFARAVQNLEGGVFLNMGSAVTGPEVFLKALSMARNVAHQQGKQIRRFTTAVFDLVPLPANWRDGTPGKDDPLYYHRAFKTVLVRAVADGGQSFSVQGDFRDTLPAFWHLLVHGPDADAAQPTPPASSPAPEAPSCS
ncbi:MAG: hypothetical protein U0736_20660 [Gemmataceae bacterium]